MREPPPSKEWHLSKGDIEGEATHLKREELPVLVDTVEISLCLTCTVKRDGEDRWVTGCPALDIFSQGKSKEEAQHSLEEAIGLWVEDCLERGTLDQALREVGFEKVHPETLRPGDEHISVQPMTEEDVEFAPGTFPVHISIPAYQAAAFLIG
jgi:predicted RNase H-like HicB family nuclease